MREVVNIQIESSNMNRKFAVLQLYKIKNILNLFISKPFLNKIEKSIYGWYDYFFNR